MKKSKEELRSDLLKSESMEFEEAERHTRKLIEKQRRKQHENGDHQEIEKIDVSNNQNKSLKN